MTEVTKEFIQKNEDEKIIEIEIERLRSFKNHPFQVKDDNEMHLLKESIEKYGILTPLIVRPVPDGVYEIIAGHRRRHAAELLGYRKVPVIIRVMNEDEAILNMVDSNLHREKISFSEKAFAYKMKNDVLKRKSGRKKGQIDHKTKKKRTVELISEECGDSPKQVQRYISLTRLIPEFLQKLDDELISFNPAVEISALKKEEQKQLLEAMDYAQAVPSLFSYRGCCFISIFIWRFYNLLRLTIKSSRFQFEEEIHAKTNFSLQNSIWKDKVFNNDEGSQIKTDCPHLISIENTGAVW